jgi:hypothetical protein
VDGADFVVWQTHFPYSSGQAASTVPEPDSFAAMAIAALILAAFRICKVAASYP